MNISTRASAVAAIAIFAGIDSSVSAGEYTATDPSIFSPYDNAQVDVIWSGSNAGYTGELQWVDTAFEGAPQTLWTNKSAISGQTHRLSRLFSAGERVDFRYEIIRGQFDTFATSNESDWLQFEVDTTNPLNVKVGVEDVRYPRGDMDHNDAVFRVLFSQATVPVPGTLALMGAGGVVLLRRRR